MEILFREIGEYLSSLSKSTNCNLLDDCSGDSLSRRVSRGITRNQGYSSEQLVTANIEPTHGLMAASLLLSFSKDKNIKIAGGIGFGTLIYFYLSGKKDYNA